MLIIINKWNEESSIEWKWEEENMNEFCLKFFIIIIIYELIMMLLTSSFS